jgi:REP element-mobilizing transposase RayT
LLPPSQCLYRWENDQGSSASTRPDYISQPLYFVTFATRDRKSIPSLDRAHLVLQQYAHCAIAKFDVALGRYVIMPDHVHLFVRGDRNFTLASWIGGLKRAISVALT